MSRLGDIAKAVGSFLVPASVPTKPRVGAQYMRGNRTSPFPRWNPYLRDPQQDVEQAWEQSAARSIDLMHNTPFIAGAIEQSTVDVVGTGLRLNAKPDPVALGLDPTSAAEWSKMCEKRFAAYAARAYDCDIEGTRSFGQMQAAQYKSWFAFGEIVAEYPWRTRNGSAYGSKIRLLSPHRLSRKSEPMTRLVQGVRVDPDGLPLSYLFCLPDPVMGQREFEKSARDRVGRTLVSHVFDGALGTKRGISPMIPALMVAKQYDQAANAAVMHQIMRSLFVFSIESDRPTAELIDSLLTPEERALADNAGVNAYDAYIETMRGYYSSAPIDVGIPGRIATPAPGEKLDIVSADASGSDYQAIAKQLMREMGACIGVMYEPLSGDYEGVTFSSLRSAGDNNWRKVLYRRENIIAPFCQAGYENWLEEEFEQGGPLAVPGGIDRFLDNRAAICRADWKGSPKPVPDELKRSQDQQLRLAMGVTSEFRIAEDNGDDYDDVCQERAEAAKLREKYGLADPIVSANVKPEPDPVPPEKKPAKPREAVPA